MKSTDASQTRSSGRTPVNRVRTSFHAALAHATAFDFATAESAQPHFLRSNWNFFRTATVRPAGAGKIR